MNFILTLIIIIYNIFKYYLLLIIKKFLSKYSKIYNYIKIIISNLVYGFWKILNNLRKQFNIFNLCKKDILLLR